MPARIQKQRGVALPFGTVYVGRPTLWGNPFRVGMLVPEGDPPELQHRATRADVVALYEDWVYGLLIEKPSFSIADVKRRLAGHDLACWCPVDGKPCHADLLLRIAAS